MLRIANISLKEGIRLRLPELWHELLLEYCKDETLPYEFEIERITRDKATKEICCICKGKEEMLRDIGGLY